MNKGMRFHIVFGIEGFSTCITFVRFLSSMYSLMSRHLEWGRELLKAEPTVVWPPSSSIRSADNSWNRNKLRILHECSCFIESIKRVGKKR